MKDQLIQVVDAGSYVEDYMGYVEGDYDFDFVNDPAAMSLSVGGHVYTAQKIEDNRYGFKETGSGYAFDLTYEKGNGTTEEYFILKINEAVTKDNPVKLSYTVELEKVKVGENHYGFGSLKDGGYRFELIYTPESGSAQDFFTWKINEPVRVTYPVQLTYSVKLTNPQTDSGTYGQYDADGSEGCKNLYTNNKAVLTPVDSMGNVQDPQYFPKPTVSYTVDKPVVPTEPETMDIEIKKVWKDGSDSDGRRPEKITVFLYADGRRVDSIVLTDDDDGKMDNTWYGVFTDMDVFDKDGDRIKYTVGEKRVSLRLSPRLYNAIAAWAEDDFRSVNSQIEYLLTECVKQRRKNGGYVPEDLDKPLELTFLKEDPQQDPK